MKNYFSFYLTWGICFIISLSANAQTIGLTGLSVKNNSAYGYGKEIKTKKNTFVCNAGSDLFFNYKIECSMMAQGGPEYISAELDGEEILHQEILFGSENRINRSFRYRILDSGEHTLVFFIVQHHSTITCAFSNAYVKLSYSEGNGNFYQKQNDGTLFMVRPYATKETIYISEEVTIPDVGTFTISGIEDSLFMNDDEIKYVSLPSTTTYIGKKALTNCHSLRKIHLRGFKAPTIGANAIDGSVPVHVQETSSGYDTDSWKNMSVIYDLHEEQYDLQDNWTGFSHISDGAKHKITYKRNFANTKWQALYVPFSMSYADWSNDFEIGLINDVNMYDTDEDGEFDVTEIELLKLKNGTLKPNTPYFIRAKSAGNKIITLEDAILYTSEDNCIDCSSTRMRFIFVGTYSGVSGSDMYENRYYALSGGSLCTSYNSLVALKPMRWYMKFENRDCLVLNPPADVRIRIAGEDATEIADVKADKKVDMTYALDGRVVNTDNLKKGMYIQNGKKVIIR